RSRKCAQDRRLAQGGGYRTAALFRAAVRAAVSSLKIKRGKKIGKKGKTKDSGSKW
ncbi:hypothetical protein KI387_040227, partial [Taxus chinensis]